MFEPKISLSFIVPGTVMLSSQECEENPKESYDEHKLVIKETKGKGKHKKEIKKIISFKTRKSRTAIRHINISNEAYDYMLNNTVNGINQKKWVNMPKDARLKAHFDLMASDFHAISYSYEILDD